MCTPRTISSARKKEKSIPWEGLRRGSRRNTPEHAFTLPQCELLRERFLRIFVKKRAYLCLVLRSERVCDPRGQSRKGIRNGIAITPPALKPLVFNAEIERYRLRDGMRNRDFH